MPTSKKKVFIGVGLLCWLVLPPAARGTLFGKTVPLDPLQKLFINFVSGHLCPVTAGCYNDLLIRDIVQQSGIVPVIDKNNSTCWHTIELETLKEVLDLLPQEYKTLKTIRIKKKNNTSGVSLSKREIYIDASGPFMDKHRLKQLWIGYLTRFLDHEYRISEGTQWRKISRWTGWDLTGNKAENKNKKGFALPRGNKSPAEDFVTSVQCFFASPHYRDPAQYLKYRLPSKYQFIQNLFRTRPDPQKHIKCEKTYKDWIDPGEVEQIELLIATPSYASVASIAGHLCLLIRRKNDIRGLSTVVSFVAETTGTRENGFLYMLRGMLGRFDSLVQEETLYDLIVRYTLRENRDIYRLKINLSRDQIEKLILRTWEIKHTFTYRYYFFNKNCTTMLLNLINDVLPEDRQVPDRFSIDLPLNISSGLFRSGIAEFVYPEYWSISRQARFNSKKNDHIKGKLVNYFYHHVDPKKAEEMAYYFQRVRDVTETRRAFFYQKLLTLYLNCHHQSNQKFLQGGLKNEGWKGRRVEGEKVRSSKRKLKASKPVLQENSNALSDNRHFAAFPVGSVHLKKPSGGPKGLIGPPCHGAPGRRRQYFQQGKLLLNFFMNAKERENYLAIVSISEQKLNSDEPINLYKSPEMVALMTSSLKLRHFLSAEISEEVAGLHGEMQDELNRYAVEQRKKRSYRCGYSPAFIAPGYNILNNRAYFSHSIKFSTFFQNLGDNSVFSLGQDTHLEMLSLGATFKAGMTHDPLLGDRYRIFYDTSFKLIDFKKILKRNEVDYTGWWNRGFGLTLYDVYSDKARGISRDAAVFNLRYIFNIFERDNFRNYLNIEVGPGYSHRTDINSQKRKFLDIVFKVNGQFHLFPNRLHTFRFHFTGRPRLNFKYYPILQFKAGVEAEWNFSAYSNTVLTTGISYEKEYSRYPSTGIDDFTRGRMSVYVSYRINNKLLPGLGDLKELLNKIF
jgi:hypothetical protein